MDSILSSFQREILEKLSKNYFITENFYFSGGTALSEFYLKHRFSEDFDFFTVRETDLKSLATNVKPIFKSLNVDLIDFQEEASSKIFFIKKGGKEKIKVDFNFWAFERLNKGRKFNSLIVDSIFDIAVNKLYTILTRKKARDFVDFYFILQAYKSFTLGKLFNGLRKKYDWVVDPLYLATCFLKIEDLHDYPKMIKEFSPEEMISYFIELAKNQKKRIVT